MPEKCGFRKAWTDSCSNAAPCAEHRDRKCVSCGAPATHECEETGQFVCGMDLCDDCQHLTFPQGHNGGVGFNAMAVPDGYKRHIRKSEQPTQEQWDTILSKGEGI